MYFILGQFEVISTRILFQTIQFLLYDIIYCIQLIASKSESMPNTPLILLRISEGIDILETLISPVILLDNTFILQRVA